MTEKRFRLIDYEEDEFTVGDDLKGEELDNPFKIVECLNTLNDEIEQLKRENKKLNELCVKYGFEMGRLEKENEQLKQTIKKVCELLEEEVDLFSDKATEHDVYAYKELRGLDNKDAYYMASSTKKAIKMLKEIKE